MTTGRLSPLWVARTAHFKAMLGRHLPPEFDDTMLFSLVQMFGDAAASKITGEQIRHKVNQYKMFVSGTALAPMLDALHANADPAARAIRAAMGIELSDE